MRVRRRSLAFVLMLPLTGCVFAVGSDDEGTEALRDRVRDLEKRVDRIERPFPGWGQPVQIMMGEPSAPAQPAQPAPGTEPK